MNNEITERTVINGVVITPEILEALKQMQDEPAYIFKSLDSVIREKILAIDLDEIRSRDVEHLQTLAGLRNKLLILTNHDQTEAGV